MDTLFPAQCFCFSPPASILELSDIIFKGYSRNVISTLKLYIAEEENCTDVGLRAPYVAWAWEEGQEDKAERQLLGHRLSFWTGARELTFLVVNRLLEGENQRRDSWS